MNTKLELSGAEHVLGKLGHSKLLEILSVYYEPDNDRSRGHPIGREVFGNLLKYGIYDLLHKYRDSPYLSWGSISKPERESLNSFIKFLAGEIGRELVSFTRKSSRDVDFAFGLVAHRLESASKQLQKDIERAMKLARSTEPEIEALIHQFRFLDEQVKEAEKVHRDFVAVRHQVTAVKKTINKKIKEGSYIK